MLAFSSIRKQYLCITILITKIIHRYTNIQKNQELNMLYFNSQISNQEKMLQMNWLISPGIFTQEGVTHNVTAILKASQP